jgi:hypothetical protein
MAARWSTRARPRKSTRNPISTSAKEVPKLGWAATSPPITSSAATGGRKSRRKLVMLPPRAATQAARNITSASRAASEG